MLNIIDNTIINSIDPIDVKKIVITNSDVIITFNGFVDHDLKDLKSKVFDKNDVNYQHLLNTPSRKWDLINPRKNFWCQFINLEWIELDKSTLIIDNHAFYECFKGIICKNLPNVPDKGYEEYINKCEQWDKLRAKQNTTDIKTLISLIGEPPDSCFEDHEKYFRHGKYNPRVIPYCAIKNRCRGYCDAGKICVRKGILYRVAEDITEIDFEKDPRLKDVRRIGSYSFYKSNVSTVKIPNSVEIIDERAFYCAEKLKTVVIPMSVKEINYQAFVGCKNLENVGIGYLNLLPMHLEKLVPFSFTHLPKLKQLTLPMKFIELIKYITDENVKVAVLDNGEILRYIEDI